MAAEGGRFAMLSLGGAIGMLGLGIWLSAEAAACECEMIVELASQRASGQPGRREGGEGRAAPPGAGGRMGMAQPGPSDWRSAEAEHLTDHVQLTPDDKFAKAGEGYISWNMKHMVFQAVPQPETGAEPDEFYTMYLADLVWEDDLITGLTNFRRISPEGSANTCGWFDPNDEHIVYFGSTLTAPTQEEAPGYSRTDNRYRWMFPPEMRVVKYDMRKPAGERDSLELVAGNTTAYQAEESLSPDGRHMVYSNLDTGDGDLYIMNLETGKTINAVSAPGYDGGPFFSPDGKRLCYRSDRRNDNHLQLFVAELAFDEEGNITGIEREYQLTNNGHVNWAPYWHPDGRHLVYAGSELGHWNYEVFIVDADSGDLATSPGPVRYGTNQRRVTIADGADVLPIFSPDGKWLTWTAQRGEAETSQLWAARFVMPLDPWTTGESGGPQRRSSVHQDHSSHAGHIQVEERLAGGE